MMTDPLYIHGVHYVDGGNDFAVEARERHRGAFPGRSARRMTHLGLLLGRVIQEISLSGDEFIVYASEFAETESLEKFVDSFPHASPALFQTSIHPSGVEQVLIPHKQEVQRFYPLTSEINLVGKALENCLILGDEEVLLLGGEERGTWMQEHHLSSEVSFAFGVAMTRNPGGIGMIRVDRSDKPDLNQTMPTVEFARCLNERIPVRLPSLAFNGWLHIEWG